ncbi:MAG: glycosyltransferase family 4 protein [Bacteroidales bacterium]|nr:glycosyltransferase family 4 protein [Bacteroidales bacterium]
MKKKVLIVTYYWPPSGGGGVQRWLKFVKYLRNFEWEPVVFTPENPEMPAIDTSMMKDIPEGIQILRNQIWEPYDFYKKFTGKKKNDKIQTAFLSEKKSGSQFLESLAVWIRGNFFIPDARKFWIKPAVRDLSIWLKKNKVDAIVTTGPPHSVHLIGMKLHHKFNIPWLADFRDPWTNIDFYDQLRLSRYADKKHHKMERMVLSTASAVTVVSKGMVSDFEKIVKRNYVVVPNGYDKDDLKIDTVIPSDSDRFTLSHIGSLTRTRNAANLWEVLGELVKEDKTFSEMLEVKNVGKIDVHAVDSMVRFGIEKYLQRIDYIPHEEVIAEQQRASVLLLLINNTPNAHLVLTGKIFEYLASGRPIICIGPPNGNAAEIIQKTGCGSVFDFSETEELKKEIFRLYQAYLLGEKPYKCSGVDQYDRENLTGNISQILDEITA